MAVKKIKDKVLEQVKEIKKAVTAKAPAARKAPAKKVAAKANLPVVTPEERQKMIDLAAYYRAEKLGWQVDEKANWLAASAEVDAVLAKRKKA